MLFSSLHKLPLKSSVVKFLFILNSICFEHMKRVRVLELIAPLHTFVWHNKTVGCCSSLYECVFLCAKYPLAFLCYTLKLHPFEMRCWTHTIQFMEFNFNLILRRMVGYKNESVLIYFILFFVKRPQKIKNLSKFHKYLCLIQEWHSFMFSNKGKQFSPRFWALVWWLRNLESNWTFHSTNNSFYIPNWYKIEPSLDQQQYMNESMNAKGKMQKRMTTHLPTREQSRVDSINIKPNNSHIPLFADWILMTLE